MNAVDVAFDEGMEELAERVRADAGSALAALGIEDAELSVVLCDDARIAALNREWRGVDRATDVLSFPQVEPGGTAAGAHLGDIVISVETAERQGREVGHGLAAELRVLLVHGLLHLLGHDHHEPGEAARMRAEERRLLAALGTDTLGPLLDREAPP